MVCFSLADIGATEFKMSLLSGGTVFETLAMAMPLIGRRQDDLYTEEEDELYPMININTSVDVKNALLDYVERPDYYRGMGEQGRLWLQDHVNGPAVDAFVDVIQAAEEKGRA